ncbi:MAG: SMI1/KNR4 family protein [Planctomycetia bacterium]|nr:SMI1/KNR4 family protein [Planctomycetia bacterium]
MKKHTFEEVEACIAENPIFALSQLTSEKKIFPASEKSIQEAEALLGLKFPKDYRTFLAKWGVLEFTYTYSSDIYGIVLDNAQAYGDPSVVFLTLKGREFAKLPHQYIAIYSDEGDEYWCIDTNDPNESVIAWDFFERCVARKIADSFLNVLYQFAANERRVKRDENGHLLNEKNTQYEEVNEIND